MKSNFFKTILNYTRGKRKNLILAVIFSFLTGIAVAVQPLIIKYIVDEGIQNAALTDEKKFMTVLVFCIIFISVSVFRMTMWAVGYKNMLISLENFLFNIRTDFFSHIQNLCMKFYDETSSGELFNYIMGSPMMNIKNFMQQFAMSVPYQSVALIISLSALISYDWLLTLVMLIVVSISILLNNKSRYKIKSLSSDMLKSESDASKYIDDVLHGSRAIKMYAIEDDIFMSFKNHIEALKTKGINLSFTQWIENAKPEFTQNVGTTLIYLIGAFSCIYRGLTVGQLVAFTGSMNIILSSLNVWFNINLVKSSAESSLERIEAILDVKSTTIENNKHVRDINIEKGRAKRNNKPCVEFENVDFGYNDRTILKNFNCKIDYNKSYGFVGTSGSGKSTITKLIMRLYDVQSGEVKMHDRNIKDFSLHDLRTSIGIVPQEPFMFHASIIDNIRISCPDAPMLDIINAMETARVHEFVNELPNGWNTIIGEDGYGISGGQKQRIAIARAILSKPDILIFDEATSALDNLSEKHIQNAMEELMKTHTVIIIAHRLTTIKNVDKIMVFDKGCIVQEGTFDELSREEGLFKILLNIT
ncbi:MAG: ABC transporter ATP-binding protein [Clostridia bacterium]|nr:ABC transporter ATP-binding protein [Clostridia bacterium]